MQTPLVLDQLLDLPPAFLRPATPFAWIWQALAGAESTYTISSDGMAWEVAGVPTASGPWLTVWGEILGIGRNPGESDGAFARRVQGTLLAPVGTPLAVQSWSRFVLNSTAITVTENLPNPGYSISIPAGLPATIISSWILSLARIRPAGVPFQILEQTGPLMLGTYSYLGSFGFAGAYLGNGQIAVALEFGPSTGNAVSILPDLLMVDPLLNGQIALGFP